jgi:hypothetical protein
MNRNLQILFLNKIDLFAAKLPLSPLNSYFPEYKGANDDYDAACAYMLERFTSLNQAGSRKQIYSHYTCATDTTQIKCKSSMFHALWCIIRFEAHRFSFSLIKQLFWAQFKISLFKII